MGEKNSQTKQYDKSQTLLQKNCSDISPKKTKRCHKQNKTKNQNTVLSWVLIMGSCHLFEGFPGGSLVKNLPANAGDTRSIPGSGDSLEKEMATHSIILAWEVPWTEEPDRLQSMGSQKSDMIQQLKNNNHLIRFLLRVFGCRYCCCLVIICI